MSLTEETKSIGRIRHIITRKPSSPCMQSVCLVAMILLFALVGCQQKESNGAELLEKGVQAMNRRDLLTSYQYTLQALNVIDQKNDSGTYLEAQTFLGVLYHTMGQRQEAYNTLRKLPTDSARGRRNRVFMLLLNYMAYYTSAIEKDFPKALAYRRRILELDKDETDLNMLYTDRLNMAELYIIDGDTVEARKLLNSVDKAKIESDTMSCIMQLQLVETKFLMLQKRYDEARQLAQKMVDRNGSYWDIDNSIEAYKVIIKIDSMHGDIKSYIYNRNQIDTLKNKVQGEQIRYKTLLVEQQYKMENMRIELAKKRMLYNCGIALLVIIAVSLALISYIQYRKTRIQKRVNEMERNNFDADIQRKRLENELLTLKMQKQKEELTQAYQDNVNMSMMLEDTPDSNNFATRLDYLESVLKRQYSDFMKNVSRRYPRLSYNETLILGFMRMKLNSKDIASALGISQESLTKARYRLRKKIGVASTEELEAIIDEL